MITVRKSRGKIYFVCVPKRNDNENAIPLLFWREQRVGVMQGQTVLCYWSLGACARLTASVLLCFSRHTASPANVEHMATAASRYHSNNSQ